MFKLFRRATIFVRQLITTSFSETSDPSLYAQAEYLRPRGPIESSTLDMHREGLLEIERLRKENELNTQSR